MIISVYHAIYRPLKIIFKEALSTGLFTSEWKKGNIVPIHKKGDKQVVKNYRPVSLLPICGKVFERLIALISYYPLHMKSFNHLMKDLKLRESS